MQTAWHGDVCKRIDTDLAAVDLSNLRRFEDQDFTHMDQSLLEGEGGCHRKGASTMPNMGYTMRLTDAHNVDQLGIW
jgi:hypothetical protein